MNIKKYIIVIVLAFLIMIPIKSNAEYKGYTCIGSENPWDEFYMYFMDKYANDQESITEEELDRMIAGPTKEERKEGTPLHGDSNTIEDYREKATNLKETREQDKKNEDDTNKGTIDDKKWTTAKKEAQSLYFKAMNEKDKTKKKKYLKQFQTKVKEMRKYNSKKTLEDSDINGWNTDVSLELKKLGEKADNIYENQVDSSGNVTTPGKKGDNYIYKQPGLNDSGTSTTDTIDGIITDGRDFLSSASTEPVSNGEIQKFSQTLYNILITIAIAVSVIIGGILGIKLMTSSAEEKAEVKQFLVPYVMGCVVVFGAFGIWKLVVTILQNTNI